MTRFRSAGLGAARVGLLAGPTALAFFSGGYFDEARAWAGLGAWLLVLVGVLAVGLPLTINRGASFALGGLALLAAWTLLSMLWAPIAGNAYHASQIVILYLGALSAAVLLLRDPRARPAVEPALAAGVVVVIGYGLSDRLLPGILHFAHSVSAQGRLEQPLTYWNAMGELAAMGFVLSARIAGDLSRPAWLRAIAAAAAAPLGVGLYVSFSRGALFACVAGLITLVVAAPRRAQLWAAIAAVAFGALAALSAATLNGVTALNGSLPARERQGAIALVLLVVISVLAGLAQRLLMRHEGDRKLRLPRRTPWIAAGVICLGLALAIVVGAHETSGLTRTLSGGATRLTSLRSNRYDYWSVALRAFASEPVHGVGAGGWSVDWLRWRSVNDFAQDAHSLELQTLAELGVVGLALLLTFFAGVTIAAAGALRATAAAAGPIAVLVVYLAHSPLDWDWQMPAVTLVAIILAGSVLAMADERPTADASSVGLYKPQLGA